MHGRPILARMSGRNMGSRSTPTASKPSARHASNVAPDPANGSNTTPPGGQANRTSQRIRSTGLTVGWASRARPAGRVNASAGASNSIAG